MPIAEAVRWTNLVSYQEGSVVSRAIVSRNTGTVTLFAFDEGQGLSEHTAPFDGREIVISGKPLQAKAGDLVLMPAHQPHTLKATTRFKMLLAMVPVRRRWRARRDSNPRPSGS